MTAKIGLEDVRFHAPHGFYEEEHLMGNEFSIDVEVEANISGAAENDDLGGTVNYATIYYLLQAEMKRPTQLLEALAYRMGNRIMNQFDSVISVKLKLRKLNPPLGGKVGAAVVEIQVSSGGGGGGYAGGLRQQHTYEDEPGGGSSFGGGSYGGGGGMGGGRMDGLTIKKPPTPAAPPVPVFDESAFEEEEEYYEEEEFEEEDYEDGGFDDFDEEDFEEMSEEEMLEYEDEEDDGDFDESDFEALMKKMGNPDFDMDDFK